MSQQLSADDKQTLQAALEARRVALAAQRAAHLGGGSRVEHAREMLLQDGDDATQRDAEREVDFARTDRDAVELAEIDGALQRLATGVYGLCTECGADIPPARLKLSPQAARCVACESAHERGQPRPATL